MKPLIRRKEVPHVIHSIDLSYAFANSNKLVTDPSESYEDRAMQGARRLWITVLFLGLRGVARGDSEDIEWYHSNNHGFKWVCDLLDLDSEKVKKKFEEHINEIDKCIPSKFPQAWGERPFGIHNKHKRNGVI